MLTGALVEVDAMPVLFVCFSPSVFSISSEKAFTFSLALIEAFFFSTHNSRGVSYLGLKDH